jgi:hypothetical protein
MEDDLNPLMEKVHRRDLLSTGSTMLNLASTDNPFGGFVKGKYFFMVGDSKSGKTFLSMTCFAESTLNHHFKDYRLIYDNIEDGMMMNLDQLFNEEVADRIEPPRVVDGEPIFSDTIESFYYNLDNAIKVGKPFIYVLDSMDSLDSEGEDKKFDQQKKVYEKKFGGADTAKKGEEKEEKVTGSYHMDKPKINSQNIRKALKGLRKTGSILIIISQTRDNVGGYGKTRAGGRSLRFYACNEFWTSIEEPITRNVNKQDRDIGVRVKIAYQKNRITGKTRDVTLDIYPTFGIDDLGSCVDFLVKENWWPVTKQTIDAKGLGLEGTREKIIRLIEKNNLENDLRSICGECWKSIEDACVLKRKNKYQPAPPT